MGNPVEEDYISVSVADSKSFNDEEFYRKYMRDPGFHMYSIGYDHEEKKTIYRTFFESTPIMGKTIRYATTGIYTRHKVGSRDEDLYFKVVDTTHPAKQNKSHTPCHLYYESPEQWEEHFGASCSDETKRIWREKYNRAIYRRMRA